MKPGSDIDAHSSRITIHVPLAIRMRGGRKVIVAPVGQNAWVPSTPRSVNSQLVKAIARSHRWQRLLEEGAYATLRELATAEQISPGYISRLLRLTLLAPPIIEAALNGKLTDDAIERLWSTEPSPLWHEQPGSESQSSCLP